MINNITLAPGFQKYDYVTALYITVRNLQGLSKFTETHVKVFPLIYYFKDPTLVLNAFIFLGEGYFPPLEVLHTGGNNYRLVQKIASAAASAVDFIRTNNSGSLDQEYLEYSMKKMKDVLLGYLYEIPMIDFFTMKHILAALNIVLDLPTNLDAIDVTTYVIITILRKIMNQLIDFLNFYEENISRSDLDDMGIILISIVSKTFQDLKNPFNFGNQLGIKTCFMLKLSSINIS